MICPGPATRPESSPRTRRRAAGWSKPTCGTRTGFAAELTAGLAYRIQVLGAPGVDCTLLAPIIESVHDALR